MTLYTKDNSLCWNALLEYLLVQKGCTFIHGAGISQAGRGIIFPAPPNTGKTTLVSHMRGRSDTQFFGDDYLIVGQDATMYAFPSDFSIYPYHIDLFPELKSSNARITMLRSIYERPIVALVKNLPIRRTLKKIAWAMGYDFLQGGRYLKVPASRLILPAKMGNSVALSHTIFLQRYHGMDLMIEPLEVAKATREITGILQSEWSQTLPVFHQLASFGIINLAEFYSRIDAIAAQALCGLKIYRVSIPAGMDNKEYVVKLEGFLEKKVFSKQS